MRSDRRVWIALVSLTILAACGNSGPEDTQASVPAAPGSTAPEAARSAPPEPAPVPPATGLSDFAGIAQLQALFDQHQDAPQLVLLLSPT